jgi:hypothetical protein
LNIEEFNDEPMNQYCLVKTVQQYNEIVCILTYWGDDALLLSADEDDPKKEICQFQRKNDQVGYNYDVHFKLLQTKQSDGTPKTVLLHKK